MSTRARRRRGSRPAPSASREAGTIIDALSDISAHRETSPRLSGGDLDADWRHAWDSGDEAVGGSTATPDQDVVDELGEALGVGQAPDAEFRTSGEILAERDRQRWRLEREADREKQES